MTPVVNAVLSPSATRQHLKSQTPGGREQKAPRDSPLQLAPSYNERCQGFTVLNFFFFWRPDLWRVAAEFISIIHLAARLPVLACYVTNLVRRRCQLCLAAWHRSRLHPTRAEKEAAVWGEIRRVHLHKAFVCSGSRKYESGAPSGSRSMTVYTTPSSRASRRACGLFFFFPAPPPTAPFSGLETTPSCQSLCWDRGRGGQGSGTWSWMGCSDKIHRDSSFLPATAAVAAT